MEIIKQEEDVFNKRADNKRKQAQKIIQECIKNGAGIYEIIDNEKIYTSTLRMVEYLKIYARPYSRWNKDKKFFVVVKTKDKCKRVFVEVDEK